MKDVQNAAKIASTKLKENKDAIIQITKSISVTPDEIPSNVIDGITKTLDVVSDPSKENMLEAAKILLPHVRKVFYSKLQEKTAQLGTGMYGKGTAVDNKRSSNAIVGT